LEIALQLVTRGNMEPAPLHLATQLVFMDLVFAENANAYWDMEVLTATKLSAVMVFSALESKSTFAASLVDQELLVWDVMAHHLVPNTTSVGFAVELALVVTLFVEIMIAAPALMQQKLASGAILRKNVCASPTSICVLKAQESPLIAPLHC